MARYVRCTLPRICPDSPVEVRHFERATLECTGLISAGDSNATAVMVWQDQVVITCDSTTMHNVLVLPTKKLAWGVNAPSAPVSTTWPMPRASNFAVVVAASIRAGEREQAESGTNRRA